MKYQVLFQHLSGAYYLAFYVPERKLCMSKLKINNTYNYTQGKEALLDNNKCPYRQVHVAYRNYMYIDYRDYNLISSII